MKKIIVMICCVLALTSLSCAAYTDYDLDESYDKGYSEGYYWGYREGFFEFFYLYNGDEKKEEGLKQ